MASLHFGFGGTRLHHKLSARNQARRPRVIFPVIEPMKMRPPCAVVRGSAASPTTQWRAAALVMLASGGGENSSKAVPDTFYLPPNFKPPPLEIPQIGVGTLAWGDPSRGWGITFNSTDLEEAFQVCSDAGVRLFDTSEVYGYQVRFMLMNFSRSLSSFFVSLPSTLTQ